MNFSELGLSEAILRAVSEQGYTQPTPIQAQAIPAVLSGGDLLAGAQTGTGKTAGFTLPILQRLSQRQSAAKAGMRRPVRTLILTPTRELAAQVEESVRTYGKHLPLTSTVIFGGVGMQPQIATLRKGVDILVATPGRLLDLHGQGVCDLSRVEIFVLDEADRMLDMGFIHDIRKVLAILPTQVATPEGPVRRQNLLFSATFSDDIKALADRLLDHPALIEVARRNTTAQGVAQVLHPVDRERKRELLAHLITTRKWRQVLVFTRMKHGANRLVEQLDKDGIKAMAIHGNKSQTARTRALADFKAGTLPVLVATDIAARGIDIDELPIVVNYDMPNVPEDYVHRIGRTGRAGAQGQAVSLVTIDESQFLADIEKLIRQKIPSAVVPGFEPDPHARPEPIKLGRMVLHGSRGSGRAVPSEGRRREGSGGATSAGRHGAPGGHRGAPAAPRHGTAGREAGGGRRSGNTQGRGAAGSTVKPGRG